MDQAEKLRRIVKGLKTNNQPVEDSNTSHARIITVTSGKGGVGKSSFSINLALLFRRMGKRVIILDADFGLANVEVMFGVVPKYTLADLMFKVKELDEVICKGPEGVMFISGGSGVARLVNLDKEQIKRLVNKLSELDSIADVIIVDTGAGISNSVLEFVSASPEVILVATPEPTSITDSYALLKALKMYPGYDANNTKIMLLGNKTINPQDGVNMYEKLSSVVTKFLGMSIDFLGAVPSDDNVVRAIMKQSPVTSVYPTSSASKAYKQVIEKLTEDKTGKTRDKKGIGNFFNSILKLNGRF